MNFLLTISLLAVFVFVGILALATVGRRIGLRRAAADPEGTRTGLGAIEAAVFGLLGPLHRVPPPLLIVASLVSALLAGHAMCTARSSHWMHTVAYAAVLTAAIHVILDLEYPRLGLIRVEAADQLLADVRASMKRAFS